MTRAASILAVAAIVALAAGATLLHWRALGQELAQPFDRHAAAFAGSATCRSCHQDHHASWYRTFHRTMTQEVGEQSVLGAFDGQVVEAWGGRMRPVRTEQGYAFEHLDTDGSVAATYRVARTVGSHRYQQYLMQRPDNGHYVRLPLLWHVGDARWVHLNGAFLYDDRQDFLQHVTTWNHNCIYCHNTGPEPGIQNSDELYARAARGEPLNFLAEARYDSQVAELGIACESCHGPGAEHARRNRDPLRRYRLSLSGAQDPTIVHPARLDAKRRTEICAQCHAQRVPVDVALVERWLSAGPTYRAGDVLAEHVRVITADEPGPPAQPDLYRLRFWADGTPRLSAYEYQGLAASPCYQQAELSCMNCHDTHGGDVHGMMRDDGRSNAPCAACHSDLAADLAAHTRHAPDSSGSRCINCHMPPMVYGVMTIHRSHRIEVPDPLRDRELERPNACAGCHLDQSADALAAALASPSGTGRRAERAGEGGILGQALTPTPLPEAEGNKPIAENTRQLLGGDPVQRAVAAHVAGRADSALNADARAALIPVLLLAMEDGYPAVRRFAWKSLRAIADDTGIDLGPEAATFDFTGPPQARAAVIHALRQRWPALAAARGLSSAAPDAAPLAALRAQAARSASINIGE
jgi:predicted CXXCH cytochrome family protein